MMEIERISINRLMEYEGKITARDKEILVSLEKCRYLTTEQIKRLHFDNSSSPRAATRTANRNLSKLKDYGLIGVLERRFGVTGVGHTANIWTLRPAGYKLLHLRDADQPTRKRFFNPSPYFLKHTLVTAEAYLQMVELCRRTKISLATLETEPDCWRYHKGLGGKSSILKPDMFAVTQAGGYEDRWFIEIDLATESYPAVFDKCQRYVKYYCTGAEQAASGVFPYVAWIVPDERRKESICKNVFDQLPRAPDIFVAITPDEFEGLIRKGAAEYMKQPP